MAKRKARAKAKKTGATKKAEKAAKASRPRNSRQARPGRKAAKRVATRASSRTARKQPAARVTRRPFGKAQGRPELVEGRRAQGRPERSRGTRPKPVALQRERRTWPADEITPSVPSTLNFLPKASSAESGHEMLKHHRREHPEADIELTAGDVDADWEGAYADGDEAPGGDNATPDQDVVEEIGRALGVEYDDAEELKGADKIIERDKHRWEYDPASAEDYPDRNKKQ